MYDSRECSWSHNPNSMLTHYYLFPGCLLDSAPPDVPPRNPSMNRLNGRIATGIMGNPADRDGDFEPSCLVRTPSGNVYIPTGMCINKIPLKWI